MAVADGFGENLTYIAAVGEQNDVTLSPGTFFSIQDAPGVSQTGLGGAVASSFLAGLSVEASAGTSIGVGFELEVGIGFGVPLMGITLPEGMITDSPVGLSSATGVQDSLQGAFGRLTKGVSSAVAGVAVTQEDTVYYNVDSSAGLLDEYRLFQTVVDPAAAIAESEANDGFNFADSITVNTLVTGTLTGATPDKDFYRFSGTAGDRIALVLDNDPDKDLQFANTRLTFYDTAGAEIGSNVSFSDGSAVGPATLPVNGLYYVSVEDNGFGKDTDYRFVVIRAAGGITEDTPKEANFPSGALNTPIPDDDATGITSTLTVDVGSPFFKADNMEVTLNLNHTFDSDLYFTLESPSGTIVKLIGNSALLPAAPGVGGSGNDFVGTVLSDSAAISINAGSAPFTGSFRPEQPLSGFANDFINGDWKLHVFDRIGGDVGTLLDWSLKFRVKTNDTPATADVLALNQGVAVGKIPSAADTDYFKVTDASIDVGDLVFAYVDTTDTNSANSDQNDSKLTVFSADGTTQIGFDDDDGPLVSRKSFDNFNKDLQNAGVDLSALTTFSGDFTIDVKDGNDRVDASQLNLIGQNIRIHAGTGNDTILGPSGDQITLTGGAGFDTIVFNPNANATVDADGGANQDMILVPGTEFNDTILLEMVGADLRITVNGVVGVYKNINAKSFELLVVQSGDGDDTIVVDNSGGAISLAINISAGDGTDSLIITGSQAVTSDILVAGARPGEGTSTTVVGAVTQSISFDGFDPALSSVRDDLSGPLTVVATGGPNAIAVGGGSTPNSSRIDIDNLASFEFANKAALTIDAGAGADAVNLQLLGVQGLVGVVPVVSVSGGDGDDTIVAEHGLEALATLKLDGGAGTDTLQADALLIGGPGNDLLIGGPGSDTLDGGDGDDTLVGGDGANEYLGGAGYDVIEIWGTLQADAIIWQQTAAGAFLHSIATAGGAPVSGTDTFSGVEQVHILAGAGNDTITVSAADALAAISTLPVDVQGGPPESGDRLMVVDEGLGNLVLYRKGQDDSTGSISVGAFAPITFAGISHVDVTPLNSTTAGTGSDGLGRLVDFKHDPFENNDTLATATYLGAGATINVDPTIDPGPFGPGAVGDQDWYRFVAAETGTLDIQAFFRHIGTLDNGRAGLPGNGDLDILVTDVAGNTIAGSSSVDDNERVTVPVVRNQTYYLRVIGFNGAVNTYNFSAINVPAPVPFQVDLQASSDSGRHNDDNVTRITAPTFDVYLDDARLAEFTLLGLVRDVDYDIQVFNNGVLLGLATFASGNRWTYAATAGQLQEGDNNFISAAVLIRDRTVPQVTGRGDLSTPLRITLDTVAPVNPTLAIDPASKSDTGVPGQATTLTDRITADSSPGFTGQAEANALVRLWADGNPVSTGLIDGSDVFEGLSVANPLSGNQAFATGQWNLTGQIDLNSSVAGFPLDGHRQISATAEDLAGNESSRATPTVLDIFVDTQGPRVTDVQVTGAPGFNLFAEKPATVGPTPVVNSIDISFNDQPIRVNGGLGFVYPAVNETLAETIGNYRLVGDATGEVQIVSAVFTDTTVAGAPGTSSVRLTFAAPLPDDRFTLSISEHVTDNPGNPLDGEFGPAFPTGNGAVGGGFSRRFNVDSRPEIGVYSSGSVAVDINGNFVFDPKNADAANRDIVFNLGFPTDRIAAGNFAPAGGVADGFDKLAAYGKVGNSWRLVMDLNNDGVPDLNHVTTWQIDGLPVAGNFSAAHSGDEIGVFDGVNWFLDSNGDNDLGPGDTIISGGSMRGLPIVGDFDGDGKEDLATWVNNKFFFDLASDGLDSNADATIDYGFSGVLERPIAADMDKDGIDDVGLWVPGRSQQVDRVSAEWYFLVSNDRTPLDGINDRVTGTVNTLNHAFTPVPFGADIFAQFGDEFALPIVGNFDPPVAGAGAPIGWLQNLYTDVLGREASFAEWSDWTHWVNSGVTYQQVAQTFMTSPERRADIIDSLYRQYMGRPADEAGIKFWTSIWDAHGGPEHVQAGIIGSAEYYRTAGNTDAAWVTALYRNILNREVDEAGLLHWTNYIKTHSKESVVLGFVTSDEYRLGLISGWFGDYLNRQLDEAGAQYWLQQMKRGLTQEALQIGILSSSEYRLRT